MASLIRPLFDGPLDIVGDVHGEIDALHALLRRLGYGPDGRHAEGRRLVFVGDLTDRGPDSPAVVELIQGLVNAGLAQCVLGNHDLNLLLGDEKFDNDWFFGRSFHHAGHVVPQVLADDVLRAQILKFFATLPLALEGQGLRVVHACWHDAMIDAARESDNAKELCEFHAKRIAAELLGSPDVDSVEQDLRHQNENPVKVLTSGIERRAAAPRTASGKLRHEERVPWWEAYQSPDLCIFGHYSMPPGKLNRSEHAICIDYGVGKRYEERLKPDFDGRYQQRLAAYRHPEGTIVFDTDDIRAPTA